LKVAISRSPLSGAVLEVDIDVAGLDRPWWDARAPLEGGDELPAEVVSFTGAMRLDLDRLGSAPFLAVPGPERPFVHPVLLGADGVVAVVSQLTVGPHTGHPIVYYAPPGADVPLRLNRWGSNSYRYTGVGGAVVEGADHPYEGDWDYDLRPWLERGKLQWIAPGDASLTLRTGADGCPYVDAAGRRAIARVQEGEAWWPDDVD
jgi:hypothetical protein